MDIKVEAPKHENQAQLVEFYEEKLTKKYGGYTFVHAIDVKVVREKETYRVSLQMKPERGQMLYAEANDRKEDSALEKAIKKLNHQLDKYKQKHYGSANRKKLDISSEQI